MANVTMPQLGETVIEGTILKWLKSEGEHVDQDEPLFEISTDKVDTEVPSPAAGTLQRILVAEGQTVAVGTPLAEIGGDGAPDATAPEPAARAESATAVRPPAEAPEGAAEGHPVQVSAPVETPQVEPAAAGARGASAPGNGGRPAPDADGPPTPDVGGGAIHPSGDAGAASTRPAEGGPRSSILSPLVRRLAAEHDVDLSLLRGTGTGGRITKNDILGHIADRGGPASVAASGADGPAPADAVPPPPVATTPAQAARAPAPSASLPQAGEEVVPLSTLRRAIGQHMTDSSHTAARAWTAVEVNLEGVVRVRERAKGAFAAREGFKLTYMPFVARAVIEALIAHPMVNAELRGDDIVLRHYVNLGIAVSIEGGLIVPVVKGADAMNLVGLARAINDVAVRARGRQLNPDDVHGHTFSITNPGPFGSLISVPIINQPNTGILSFDAVQKRPVVIDDAIAIRHMVYLSMSWDHRTIDGALATQFLSRVKDNLEGWDFTEDLSL
jgi:pyruvate dehydrogenase E2 component (dihydrolipoamide acetyltransferase)